jgi:truncated hemoglobin YjbI
LQETFARVLLFEQLDGQAAVEAAVDKFYDRVLADDRINHFFQGLISASWGRV